MGLFDRFKKRKIDLLHLQPKGRLENFPEMLTAKLLFFEKPNLDADKILKELKLHFSKIDNSSNDKAFFVFFP